MDWNGDRYVIMSERTIKDGQRVAVEIDAPSFVIHHERWEDELGDNELMISGSRIEFGRAKIDGYIYLARSEAQRLRDALDVFLSA